jgi:hypothetical protein
MVRRASAYALLVPYVTIGIGLLVFRNAWIAASAHHLSMGLILLLARRRHRLGRFRIGSVRILLIAMAVGAAGGPLLYLLWPVLSVPLDIGRYVQEIGLTPAAWPYFIAYFVLVNGLIEEYYWRDYLGSDARLPTANDFLFSGYHAVVLAGKVGAIWLLAIFAVLALAGWFWRQLKAWSGDMATPVLSHVAADASVMVAIYLMTSPPAR